MSADARAAIFFGDRTFRRRCWDSASHRHQRSSEELPHRRERGVMWGRKCRVRRAFRRAIRFNIGNTCRLWCVQKANAPYDSPL